MANSNRSLLIYLWLVGISFTTSGLLAQPLAKFSATPVQGCNPLKVDFINNSSGAVSYTWFFGNGNSSTLVSPSAVYNTPGKFTVTLVATDMNGVTDSLVLKDYVTVFRTPKANFGAIKQSLCSGDTAFFTDKSILGDGPIKSFKWDFGNGGVSYLQNPTYIYNGTGSYDVTFAITDTNGCSSSVKIGKYMQSNSLPVGNFTTSRTNFCKPPATIKFSATAQGTGPFAFSWSYGDGSAGTGPVTDHMYNNLGAYSVTLNVTDGNGCTLKIQRPNLVQIKEPTAEFTAAQTVVCAGQKVGFHNQSFPTDGAGRFHWDFGNGDTASVANPEVTFKTAGVYSVSLTYFWDKCQVTKTKTAYITVSDGAVGSIQPRDTSLCHGKGNFVFRSKGSGYNRIIWQLGNNKPVETDASGGIKFPLDTTNGTYTVKATFLSDVGCKSVTDSTRITLGGPVASISIDKTNGCIPYNVNAFSSSVSKTPIVTYKWTGFGVNVNSTNSSVAFVNNTFGNSALQLLVTDANGCSDLTMVLLGAGVPVESKFAIDKKIICSNEPLKLYNLSRNQDPDTVIFLWSWTNNDTILYPPLADSTVVRFRHRQSKNAKLTFTANSFGCIARSSITLEVLGAYLDGKVKMLCDKDSLLATNNSADYTSTFWKYTNESKLRVTDTRLKWGRLLSQTDDIWLYAFNDANKCKDSMPILLDLDPQDASFTYTLDCGSGILQTNNTYVGTLHDTMYEWLITNTDDQSSYFVKSKNLTYRIPKPGQYKLQMFVRNKDFECTPSKVVKLNVKPLKDLRGNVTLDRTSCYPVKFTLNDNNYSNWRTAKWIIGGDVELKDDAKTINYTYTSNKTDLEVYLVKTDSQGCSYTDTFKYQINGMKASIGVSQDNTDCLKPILKFQSSVSPTKPNTQYLFAWDFGHRTSTRYYDTVRTDGKGSVTATLVVTESGNGGCKSIATKTVEVKAGKPKAHFFTSDSLVACPPLNVSFVDNSVSEYGPITNREWNFGDLTYSDKLNPGKLYVVPGKYTVSLIVTNSSNCKDTYSVSDLVVVKGPYGTYSIDKSSGCAPLRVNLKTQITGNVTKFDFDMGDGNVIDKGINSHNFAQAGVYIPRLILIDSSGCKYSPEPTDTIRVYPTPIAQFTSGPLCLNQVYKIPHTTICKDSVTVEWSDDVKKLGTQDTLPVIFSAPGQHNISLKVITEHNCADSITKPLFAYGIRPKVSIPKEEYCLGEDVRITDLTTADTAIVDKKIWIGSELLANTTPWHYIAKVRGKLPLDLEYTDAIGCKASFNKEVFIKVGDTAAPPALTLYRTSVLSDVATETKFSSSLEPDFKNYQLYLQDGATWKRIISADKMEDTVLITAGLNTLKNSYCHIITQKNFCGAETEVESLIKHCTIETQAIGDTNASVVNWSPYIGWKSVGAYNIWRKKKDETNYVLLNTVPGDVLTYVDSAVYCNVEYDFHIEGIEDGGYRENSFSDTSRSKPIHFHTVPAPELWRTTVDNNLYVHTEWIMPVKSKYPVNSFSIIRNDGTPVKVEPGAWFFDDYDTDVQNKNYTYTVVATDVCNTSSPRSNVGRNIVLTAKSDNENQDPKLSWTPYIYWNEGVQDYTIERSLSGGEFIEVGRVGGTELTFTDNTLPKHCEKDYQYRVIATRSQPASFDSSFNVQSVSNHYQYVPEIRFFIPNAFTPNNNNLNEGFHPDGVYFSGYDMKIYNRYGEKIYENSDCMNSWDGKYMNEDAPEGVYAYFIEAWDVAGKSYKFNGTIHLMR